MPRVRINSTKYKTADLPKFIRSKLVDSNLEQKDLAVAIGITPQAFSNRMKKGLFSYSELVNILAEVKASDEEIVRLMKKEDYK